MKALVVAAVIAAVVGVSAGETKLGAGVTLKESTSIVALAKTPQDFVGKTVRVDGIATAVCAEMGCWMAVAPEGDTSGVTVRLKVDDGVIVFPVSAKGRKVSAEGVFEAVGAGEAKEAAGEHAVQDPKASKDYQIKATGAVIK